jgi:hypothetical protein
MLNFFSDIPLSGFIGFPIAQALIHAGHIVYSSKAKAVKKVRPIYKHYSFALSTWHELPKVFPIIGKVDKTECWLHLPT